MDMQKHHFLFLPSSKKHMFSGGVPVEEFDICTYNPTADLFFEGLTGVERHQEMGQIFQNTVDGRNPKQPPKMYQNPVNNGLSTTNLNCWVYRISGYHQQCGAPFLSSAGDRYGVPKVLALWPCCRAQRKRWIAVGQRCSERCRWLERWCLWQLPRVLLHPFAFLVGSIDVYNIYIYMIFVFTNIYIMSNQLKSCV